MRERIVPVQQPSNVGAPGGATIDVMPMRVAFIAAECEPWAKTGGLADVVDALARALGSLPGDELDGPIDVYLPRYRGIEPPAERVIERRTDHGPDGGPADGRRLRLRSR